MENIDELFTAADAYLQTDFGGRLGALKARSVTASTRDEISTIRAEVGQTWKELNLGAVKTFVQFVKTFNMQSPFVGRKTKADKKAEEKSIADAPRHTLFVSMMESLQESQVNVSTSIFEAKGGLRPAVLPVASQEVFLAVAASPVVRKALKHIANSCAKGTSACCQPLDGGAAVIKRFQQVI